MRTTSYSYEHCCIHSNTLRHEGSYQLVRSLRTFSRSFLFTRRTFFVMKTTRCSPQLHFAFLLETSRSSGSCSCSRDGQGHYYASFVYEVAKDIGGIINNWI